jgi:hypothetical protein
MAGSAVPVRGSSANEPAAPSSIRAVAGLSGARVVFGGVDPKRGASYLTEHLTKIYDPTNLPCFVGPLLPDICDPLFERARRPQPSVAPWPHVMTSTTLADFLA